MSYLSFIRARASSYCFLNKDRYPYEVIISPYSGKKIEEYCGYMIDYVGDGYIQIIKYNSGKNVSMITLQFKDFIIISCWTKEEYDMHQD